MKTVIKAGLSADKRKEVDQEFAASGLLREQLIKVLSDKIESTRREMLSIGEKSKGKTNLGSWRNAIKNNEKAASKLDSKDYSDEEVTGGDKKSYSTKEFDTKKEAEKRMSLMNSNSEYSDLKINKTSNNKYTISFKKSF